MLPILAVIYLSQQVSYFSEHGTGGRPVDHVKIGAWVVLSIVLLLALATNGVWFQRAEVRDLVNDENTRANRASALSIGFLAAMATAFVLYLVDQFEPLATRAAIHLIVSLGLGAALFRFAWLERRALRDG